VNDLSGNPMGVAYGPGKTIWVSLLPIACLLLGVAGLVGLFRVLSMVNSPDNPMGKTAHTQVLVACGVLSVVLFNASGGGFSLAEAGTAEVIYAILPLIGTIYFLYIARRRFCNLLDNAD
jgi:hypothetical protein